MAAADVGRLYQGVAKESAAFRLMQRMGWEEGQGLGRHKQGISTHVRVTKKADTAGIGVEEARKAASDWTVNTAVFDAILQKLNVQATGSAGAAASGLDAGDSEPGSGRTADPAVNASASAPAGRQKTARPQGRYHKREAGKCVRSYSDSDLSAILGMPAAAPASPAPPLTVPQPPSPPAQPERTKAREGAEAKPGKGRTQGPRPKPGKRKAESTTEGEGDEDKGGKRKKGERRAQKAPSQAEGTEGAVETTRGTAGSGRRRAKSASPENEAALPPAPFSPGAPAPAPAQSAPSEVNCSSPPPAPAPSWWGHRSGFVSGGLLGSASRPKAAAGRGEKGFSEADQEGLYHSAQGSATSGKQGLGVGSLPKKVAGARWHGKKVTFGDQNEGEGESEEESREDGGLGAVGAEQTEGQGVKWKAILLKLLRKRPEGVGMKRLVQLARKRAVRRDHSLVSLGLDTVEGAVLAEINGGLKGRLVLADDVVRLV